MSIIWSLFRTFFKIGLLSIGGGYAIIPLIQEQVVRRTGWISEKMFTDIITISQMTPGPLAVNTSTFVGLQAGGLLGAVAATTGCVLCGAVISVSLYRFFSSWQSSIYILELLNGLKSASLGLILSAAAAIVLLALFGTSTPQLAAMPSSLDWTAFVLFGAILFLARRWKSNPIFLMLLSGVAGAVCYL